MHHRTDFEADRGPETGAFFLPNCTIHIHVEQVNFTEKISITLVEH